MPVAADNRGLLAGVGFGDAQPVVVGHGGERKSSDGGENNKQQREFF